MNYGERRKEQNNPIQLTTTFKARDKRIYCTIAIRGPDGVHLGARWYYGDKLISDKIIDFGTRRRGVWWLEMAPGQKFPVGGYRVEIYLVKAAIKVKQFKVVE